MLAVGLASYPVVVMGALLMSNLSGKISPEMEKVLGV